MIIGEYIGSKPNTIENKSVFGLVTPNHNVGVELELENFRYDFSGDSPDKPRKTRFYDVEDLQGLQVPSKQWLIVKDNSLRKGAEFIFDGPKKGKDIVDAFQEMKVFLNKYKRYDKPARASDRCSVHVHLDVRDLDEITLNRLIMVYVLIERVLFEYVSPLRLKNNYCRAVTDSQFKTILANLSDRANPSYFNDALSLIRNSCDKYSALNLLPIQSYGTVEFRHHQGSTDMDEVLDWVNIILAIKLAAYINPNDIVKLYNREGYKSLLNCIFEGTAISGDFIERPEVKLAVKKGMNDYLEIIHYNELKERSNRSPLASLSTNLLGIFAEKYSIEKIELKQEKPTYSKKLKFPPPPPSLMPSSLTPAQVEMIWSEVFPVIPEDSI